MIGRETHWADLGPGTYVRDSGGKTWRIEDRRQDTFLLIDRDQFRRTITPGAHAKVTVMEPTHEEAVAAAVAGLDGTVIAEQQRGKPWVVRPLERNKAEICKHMEMFHGTWAGDVKTIQKLLDLHRDDHLADPPPKPPHYQAHEHRMFP